MFYFHEVTKVQTRLGRPNKARSSAFVKDSSINWKEAFTEGETIDEALFNAAEVLTLTLEGRMEENQLIPVPTANVPGAHYIAPDAKTQAALLARWAGKTAHGRVRINSVSTSYNH